MKLLQLLFLTVSICTIFSCNNKSSKPDQEVSQSPELLVLDRLLGTWQSEDGKIFERWSRNENGSFNTVVFSINGSDTSWNENGKIYREGESWIFENTVKGQNEGKAVKFTSVTMTEKSIHFNNPAHDFPTDINYSVPDSNTVNAYIVGPNEKGGKDTIPYNYRRFSE